MRRQPRTPRPAYHIFNLGFSGWGARFSRTAATHKSSKTGLTALTAALAQELRAAGAFATSHHATPSMPYFSISAAVWYSGSAKRFPHSVLASAAQASHPSACTT